MNLRIGSPGLLSVFADQDLRLIAMVDPQAVRQTSDKVQSGVVRGIDDATASETIFSVEIKNGAKTDMFLVPLHSIRSFLVIEKKAEGE